MNQVAKEVAALGRYRAPVPSGARKWLTPAAWVAAVAAVLLLLFPVGFPNYDTIYALVWGRELAHGVAPDYAAALPPTPHPLADLLGLVTTPLGDGAVTVTVLIAYITLGLTGYLVYRLGELWFGRAIGVLAALIVLTRAPYLSNGLRAYVDLPFITLCLGALLLESRRPRAGWPVLALLVPAGLLRPEAWLFSVAYLAYLVFFPAEGPRLSLASAFSAERRKWLIAMASLALAAPILWAGFDWVTAGSPTYSFTGTRETVETLSRHTGPVDLVLWGPRALGEVLQWPGMIGATGGVALGYLFLRRRSGLGIAAAILALGAFALLAIGGLAIIARYTMLAAALLSIFVALGLLGWRLLERDHPWRRAWQIFAGVVALMFVIWGPNQYDLLHRVNIDLTNQSEIEGDLNDLANSGAFAPICGPISVPNHRAVPRLAFDLEVRPSQIISSTEQRQPRHGDFLDPASPFVVHNFILDPNDPARLNTSVPAGFQKVAVNRSWLLYRRC